MMRARKFVKGIYRHVEETFRVEAIALLEQHE
jgi:hypothetical protein